MLSGVSATDVAWSGNILRWCPGVSHLYKGDTLSLNEIELGCHPSEKTLPFLLWLDKEQNWRSTIFKAGIVGLERIFLSCLLDGQWYFLQRRWEMRSLLNGKDQQIYWRDLPKIYQFIVPAFNETDLVPSTNQPVFLLFPSVSAKPVNWTTPIAYVRAEVSPHPNEMYWPVFLDGRVSCVPEVTVSFRHQDHDVVLELIQNDVLDVDQVPVLVMSDGQIVRWTPPAEVGIVIQVLSHRSKQPQKFPEMGVEIVGFVFFLFSFQFIDFSPSEVFWGWGCVQILAFFSVAGFHT